MPNMTVELKNDNFFSVHKPLFTCFVLSRTWAAWLTKHLSKCTLHLNHLKPWLLTKQTTELGIIYELRQNALASCCLHSDCSKESEHCPPSICEFYVTGIPANTDRKQSPNDHQVYQWLLPVSWSSWMYIWQPLYVHTIHIVTRACTPLRSKMHESTAQIAFANVFAQGETRHVLCTAKHGMHARATQSVQFRRTPQSGFICKVLALDLIISVCQRHVGTRHALLVCIVPLELILLCILVLLSWGICLGPVIEV